MEKSTWTENNARKQSGRHKSPFEHQHKHLVSNKQAVDRTAERLFSVLTTGEEGLTIIQSWQLLTPPPHAHVTIFHP